MVARYMDIDSGEWVTACTTSTPSATATGLKPGHLYQVNYSSFHKNPSINFSLAIGKDYYSYYLHQSQSRVFKCVVFLKVSLTLTHSFTNIALMNSLYQDLI